SHRPGPVTGQRPRRRRQRRRRRPRAPGSGAAAKPQLTRWGDYLGDNCRRLRATSGDSPPAYPQLKPPDEWLLGWSARSMTSLTRRGSLFQSQYRPPVKRLVSNVYSLIRLAKKSQIGSHSVWFWVGQTAVSAGQPGAGLESPQLISSVAGKQNSN